MRIPRGLLTHRCILRKYRTDRDLLTRTRVSDQELSGVRVMPEAVRTGDVRHTRTQRRGVLYYDAVSSLPTEAEFITDGLDSVIVFRQHEYPVTGAAYFYDDKGLHHIELSLGGAV